MSLFWRDAIILNHSNLDNKFGISECPNHLIPKRFKSLFIIEKNDNNYGNYIVGNSQMVFIPAFYYRIGHPDSPRFERFGYNAIDIVLGYDFPSDYIANKDGFTFHRAFIDGGKRQPGFFIDKYLASRDANACKSEKCCHPISLCYDRNEYSSINISNCFGRYFDAITLARARGKGFHCASIFQYNALGLLSLALSQIAKNENDCAWYSKSPLNNFPKGCNDLLKDANDQTVKYLSSYMDKPLIGAYQGFEKTTHNGQANGVADLNGSLNQVVLGITKDGSSAYDKTFRCNLRGYVLKETIAMADLTSGWNGKNDAWGDREHLRTLYHEIDNLFDYDTKIGWWYFKNKNLKVLSSKSKGDNYYRTSIGIPMKRKPDIQLETNPYITVSNLVLLNSGSWYSHNNANIFTKSFFGFRDDSSFATGFRCAYYPI